MERQASTSATGNSDGDGKAKFLTRLAAWFRRRRRVPVERNPLTPKERALIANLSAMR